MEYTIHYLTDLLATGLGVYLYIHSTVDDTVPKEKRYLLIIGALIGALIGSRLIAALENPPLFIHPSSLMYYVAGKTIIGGIAGGILGIEIAKRILGIQVWTGDRALIPLMVAIGIGRIGCFVLGVQDGTVGGPCDYFWCLEQGDGILRHPNSLYEIAFVTLFYVGYRVVHTLKPRLFLPILSTRGASFRLFIVAYFTLRLGIEFLKETHPLIIGLNSIQLVCLVVILWYIHDLAFVYTRRVRT